MKLIVGLGNPGENYINTRHNAGYLFVDEFKKSNNSNFVVKKSDSFMNESGVSVKNLVNKYKISLDDLFVAHDDLDILLGSFKIQKGRGPKDHNGISSVDSELGSKEYWHIRIGVDKRDSENRVLGEEYVLQNFTEEQRKILDTVIKEIIKKILELA